MASIEEKTAVVKTELDKLKVLVDFDDIIFDTHLDMIIKRINDLKKHQTTSHKDNTETTSTKSWADQSEEEDKITEITRRKPIKDSWAKMIDTKPALASVRFSFDQLYDYPFTHTMKPTHQINFHTGTYHWVSRWFNDECNILVKTDKFVQFTLEVIHNRAVLSYYVNDKIKSVRLCLMDQVITCYDQDSKSYEMKVKLLRDVVH